MRASCHCFYVSLPVTLMLLVTPLLFSAKAIANESIVLPNSKLFGKHIGGISPLKKPTRVEDAIYPKNVHLDLDGPIVYGIMTTYSESVTFQNLVDAVNLKHKKWSRDSDGEMAKWGVTVWRNEDDRYAIQVSESQIIMIWLDREISQKEVNGVTKSLFEDTLKRALTSHDKAVTKGKGTPPIPVSSRQD